jgi:hypothetical protein
MIGTTESDLESAPGTDPISIQFLSNAELALCGGITLPKHLWRAGHHITHPVHGDLYLVRPTDDGGFFSDRPVGVPTSVAYLTETLNSIEQLVLESLADVAANPVTDKRWAAIGKTDIEKGFLALRRAVTKTP